MADINPSTLAPGLGREISKIPRSVIEKQDIYARGLVRFDEATNDLINTATSTRYKTLQEAINDTARLGISEVNVFTGTRGVLSPDPSGFGPLSDLTYNINEYLRLDNPEAKAFKSRHAVLSSLEGKNIELVRIGYSDTTGETVSQMSQLYDDLVSFPDLDVMAGGGVEKRLAKGDILPPGYLASRDGSSILLRLRYQTDEGYKYLSGEETVSLFNTLDVQDFNIDRLAKLIDPLDADGSMNLGKNSEQILGNQLGKSGKRKWQSLVERNMVIDQEGVGDVVSHLSTRVGSRFKDVAPKTLEDSYLFFDPALETTLKAFGLEESYTNTLLGDTSLTRQGRLGVLRERLGTRISMEGETAQSAQQYFRSALELQGLAGDDEFNEFAGVIQSQFRESIADKKNQKISLDDIISRIEKAAGGEGVPAELKGKYQRYVNALGEMKKIDDGSGFITGVPMRQHAESLRSSIKEAEAILSANTYAQGSDEAMQLTGNITSFKTQLDRIVTNSDDFLDGGKLALREFKHDTARMFIGRGQGKSVFDLIQGKVEERLARLGYMGAGSTELLKKEISFARLAAPGSEELGPHVGQQITMNINTGHGRDMVYSEPQAMLFHREQYGEDFARQVGESAQVLEGEIKNISDGIVSERLRRSILNDATLDLEGMDIETLVERFGSRENAVRIRANAKNLQQVLSSGNVRVNEIPEVANQLLNQAQRDAFRTGKTYKRFVGGKVQDMPIFNYAMPYAQRQAIDTEGRVSRGVGSKVLGVTDDTTFSRFMSESGDQLSLFKFRHVGHKMLVPDIASTSLGLYEAGGGFDLDDKWITNLQSIKNSEGVRKLASFAWRQPTGPQEFALMAPHLDEDTIMRMFGDETQMGEKFRRVSNSVSDMINNRTGFVLDLSSDLSGQPSALGMEQLSKEEKIFKYLNSLAHGSKEVAQKFKQSAGDITQEDLERAIFKLVDLNGEQGASVELFTGQASINVDDFAREYMGAGEGGVKSVKSKYFNIGTTSDAIIKKAAMTKAGTMLALNADEILESGNTGLIASYRQSSLTQILKSSASPAEDKIFINSIEKMYNSQMGAGSYKEAFDYVSSRSADTVMTPMDFAVRVSGRLYKNSIQDGLEEVTMRS
jgi:hypothetical protein